MRLNRTIATLGLIGLLGCGVDNKIEQQEPVTAEQTAEEPVVVSVEAPSLEPVLVVSNFQPDCSVPVEVQRKKLVDDFTYWVYNMLDYKTTPKVDLASTIPSLATDFIRVMLLPRDEYMKFYEKAKNLAGCMDPKINFDEQIVLQAYRVVQQRIEQHDFFAEDNEYYIYVANGIAGQINMDVRSYTHNIVNASVKRACEAIKSDDLYFAKGLIDFVLYAADDAHFDDRAVLDHMQPVIKTIIALATKANESPPYIDDVRYDSPNDVKYDSHKQHALELIELGWEVVPVQTQLNMAIGNYYYECEHNGAVKIKLGTLNGLKEFIK